MAIYPNDHRPAHVHVIGRGCEAMFSLENPPGSVGLRENYGFSRRELTQIGKVLMDQRAELWAAWEGIHGNV